MKDFLVVNKWADNNPSNEMNDGQIIIVHHLSHKEN